MRPTRRHRASNPRTPPYSALHRVGLAWPPCHHDAGALLPHHFTFAAGRAGVLCNFCGAFPGVSPAGRYPAPCSSVSGLSSNRRLHADPRLPGLHPKYTAFMQGRCRTSPRCASGSRRWGTTWRSDRRLDARERPGVIGRTMNLYREVMAEVKGQRRPWSRWPAKKSGS